MVKNFTQTQAKGDANAMLRLATHMASGLRVSYVPISRWNISEMILIQCSHPVHCAAQRA
jgi:hypothetical protein